MARKNKIKKIEEPKSPRMLSRDALLGEISQYDLGMEFDYRREYHCEDECDPDDYCRCSTIEDASVDDKTPINIPELASRMTKGSSDLLWEYFVERLLVHSKASKHAYWTPSIHGGYYGEELGGATLSLEIATDILNTLEGYKNSTPRELVESALLLEYGHLLSGLEDLDWSIDHVDPRLIDVPQKDHYAKLDKNMLELYKDRDLIIAVVVPVGDRYKLVDGYHRLAANKDKSKIMVLVGKKNDKETKKTGAT